MFSDLGKVTMSPPYLCPFLDLRHASSVRPHRSTRGLDGYLNRWGGEGPVLCNYNSIHKMEPDSFTVFTNILKRWSRKTAVEKHVARRFLFEKKQVVH